MRLLVVTIAGAVALAATGVGVSSAAWAQTSPIAQRQTILKGFGGAAKDPAAMLQGKAPFDLGKVKAALTTIEKGAGELPTLFPNPPQPGEKTGALPAIWANKSDFNSRFAKLGADAKAAKIAITDEASFKANFPKVLGNCGGCHKEYRAKPPA